jgi:hypothetical protein
MNLRVAIDKVAASGVTPEAVTTAIRSGTNVPSFMTDTATCDGTVVSSPITCVRGRRVLEVKGGTLSDLSDQWYDGTAQVSLG